MMGSIAPVESVRTALVALHDRAQSRAVVARLTADGVRVAVLGDPIDGAILSVDPGAVIASVERVEVELGSLSILVCDAVPPESARFIDTPPTEWFEAVRSSMFVPFAVIRAAVPSLRRAGDSRILLVGTGWGATQGRDATAAAAAQGGLVALMKTLARDLGPDGIIVNEIALPAQACDQPAIPAALASAVSYLAGPHGSAMVGQILTLGRGGELRP